MRVLSHFPAIGVSNTYVIGPAQGGEAILVDPGRFDTGLLELIEDHGYDIKTVLVTHDHENHIGGLRTLLKVYDAQVVSGNNEIMGCPARPVNHGEHCRFYGIPVEVLPVKGHSPDSRVYRIGCYLFTGDMLSAGRVGSAMNSFARENLLQSLHEHLLSLNEAMIILPGHGPPTTVGAERRWNPDLTTFTPHI
ncbi:MAG: MBL fold metallo-hydrolase [Spirochaetales bacterium]|nr:MBL fold metallo-hydrolase [Spirochaetales bacterium]